MKPPKTKTPYTVPPGCEHCLKYKGLPVVLNYDDELEDRTGANRDFVTKQVKFNFFKIYLGEHECHMDEHTASILCMMKNHLPIPLKDRERFRSREAFATIGCKFPKMLQSLVRQKLVRARITKDGAHILDSDFRAVRDAVNTPADAESPAEFRKAMCASS